jgi:hypothetical protein
MIRTLRVMAGLPFAAVSDISRIIGYKIAGVPLA